MWRDHIVFMSNQGSLAWCSSYHLLGDVYEQAPPRAKANCADLRANGSGLKMDILQWDVRSLPLRAASVDVVVTDLVSGSMLFYIVSSHLIIHHTTFAHTLTHADVVYSAIWKEVSFASFTYTQSSPPPRSGRKVDNRELYPLALEELGRVCKPNTSRAILLTHDNRTLSRVGICTLLREVGCIIM